MREQSASTGEASITTDPISVLELRSAQATIVLQRLPATLLANSLVSLSAYTLATWREADGRSAFLWLCVVLSTLVLRAVTRMVLLRRGLAARNPLLTLVVSTMGSGISGAVWATLPFILPEFRGWGVDGGIYLMVLGTAAGSVLMSVGFRFNALAFAMPCFTSVTISLFLQGSAVGSLLGLNVIALTIILVRGSQISENIFRESIERKREAAAVTQSLQAANHDILEANARLEMLANRDPLTGLANRAAFNEVLRHGIATAGREERRLTLLVIDLDRFKHINDTMGHQVGDELLITFAARLRSSLPTANSFVARLGGDEFAVIISGKDPILEGARAAEIILNQGRTPFLLQGQTCMLGSSVGLATYPDHAETAEELFVSADMALYRSKDQGRGRWRKFDPKLRAAAERQRQIEADIVAAIEAGQVEAWFQPQINLEDDAVIGFEALVRWHHQSLGFISPPEIVQAAYAIHQSERLTGAIADAACRLLLDLPRLGLPEATVAINVSPREFALYSLAELLDGKVARHAIRPELLEVEITEEALLDTVIAGEQLKHLEQSGFALAVDDFGAGHSSLTRLIDLKVDRLKIDRGIITQIAASERNQAIVSALIRLGEALSVEMLAEGVETQADAATLKRLGCRQGQGYLFARPMPQSRIAGWLAERQERAIRKTRIG
ncbi:bifunctional diguanylate cyclase/phosphodiesterase [Rhizobium sp. SSA_523]|uniref:putative bifunctional diguanylate cyclase/phosphodiesterase n=1 Tax=Rhizobium sp. SSA_523 TaxID=2952477 RepID=UPI0020906486|nr:EAL domain-containing protein [Rhizobium sp. SSA_523]MCO5730052.1 EAL domain-containing protein [Rhizobium sp. SSA_523]WKC25119.1 EAL domain-containing protein [Rhizobium sp. SSA_523]